MLRGEGEGKKVNIFPRRNHVLFSTGLLLYREALSQATGNKSYFLCQK